MGHPPKDSFVWDPPADGAVLLQLIRANAQSLVVGPVDGRLIHTERAVNTNDQLGPLVEIGKWPDSWGMYGAWDLVAAVRTTGTMFEYLGAYYRPSRLDNCSPAGSSLTLFPLRFGVLTTGDAPKTPEEFLKRYGNVFDNDLNIFKQVKLMQANRQIQLMAYDAIALAATSEFREALDPQTRRGRILARRSGGPR